MILGLIWSLIAHYQLGASNFPPKKLMLAWLKVKIQIESNIQKYLLFFLEHDSKSPPGKSDLKVLAYLHKAHNDNQMLAVSGQF